MGASIARKRTRLDRRVLRHKLAQVCASSCINYDLFFMHPNGLSVFKACSYIFLPKMGLRKSRYLKFRCAILQCVVLHALVLMYSWLHKSLLETVQWVMNIHLAQWAPATQRHSVGGSIVTDDFFSFYACCSECTATSSFLHTCGLSYPLSSNSHKIQHGVSSSLSSQSPEIHFAWLQLLATNSHCECELEHSMDMFLPLLNPLFSRCWDKSSVCLGKTTCQKWTACSQCACVRALSPSKQRLIPSRSHCNDGTLRAVELMQRSSPNPTAGKSIPIQSEKTTHPRKNFGWLRMSSFPGERAVRSTAKKVTLSCHTSSRIDHPAIFRHPTTHIWLNQGQELRQTLLGELERSSFPCPSVKLPLRTPITFCAKLFRWCNDDNVQ